MSHLHLSSAGRRYGWRRQKKDHRDFEFLDTFAHKITPAAEMPEQFSLRAKNPPIMDQGDEGACTAFGGTRSFRFLRMKQGLTDFELSENFSYYNERLIEGDPHTDSGAEVRDFFVATTDYGAAPATLWPYEDATLLKRPPHSVYAEARSLIVPKTAYAAVQQSEQALKTALTSGFIVVMGFDCYQQLESAQAAENGILMPPAGASIGGHCVCITGWDDTKAFNGVTGFWEFANSWGASWGDEGYGWAPKSYFLDPSQASDFWVFDAL